MDDTDRIENPNPISNEILQLAKKYHVTVSRRHDGYGTNCGACYGEDIYLSNTFDDKDEELYAFFHELGHIELERKYHKGYHIEILLYEGAAWEIGYGLASKEGYSWASDYNSKAFKYARREFTTYIGCEYDNLVADFNDVFEAINRCRL